MLEEHDVRNLKLLFSLLTVATLAAVSYMMSNGSARSVTASDNTLAKVQTADLETSLGRRFVSRSPMNAYVSASRPMEGLTVIVDPGHGGRESRRILGLNATGATGIKTRQEEKDLNLRVGLLLRYYLQQAGASVYMTRTTDAYANGMCVGMNGEKERCERAYLANRNRAAMFISVHHDYAIRTGANHSTVFFNTGNVSSLPLAENIASSLTFCLGNGTSGAKPGNTLTVLHRLTVPGVLVECSFMSNPSEDVRLYNLAYNKLEAKAIAIGCLNYLQFNEGRNVDFAALFGPIDDQWQKTVIAANNSIVRRKYVAQPGIFGNSGYKYTEFDANNTAIAQGNLKNVAPVREALEAAAKTADKVVVKTADKVLDKASGKSKTGSDSKSASSSGKGKSTASKSSDTKSKTTSSSGVKSKTTASSDSSKSKSSTSSSGKSVTAKTSSTASSEKSSKSVTSSKSSSQNKSTASAKSSSGSKQKKG